MESTAVLSATSARTGRARTPRARDLIGDGVNLGLVGASVDHHVHALLCEGEGCGASYVPARPGDEGGFSFASGIGSLLVMLRLFLVLAGAVAADELVDGTEVLVYADEQEVVVACAGDCEEALGGRGEGVEHLHGLMERG